MDSNRSWGFLGGGRGGFLGLHPRHMEVLRLGVKLELQLPAAVRDPSRSYDLYHSSQQHRILNLLNKARDWTWILMILVGLLPLNHNRNFQQQKILNYKLVILRMSS